MTLALTFLHSIDVEPGKLDDTQRIKLLMTLGESYGRSHFPKPIGYRLSDTMMSFAFPDGSFLFWTDDTSMLYTEDHSEMYRDYVTRTPL